LEFNVPFQHKYGYIRDDAKLQNSVHDYGENDEISRREINIQLKHTVSGTTRYVLRLNAKLSYIQTKELYWRLASWRHRRSPAITYVGLTHNFSLSAIHSARNLGFISVMKIIVLVTQLADG